MTIYTGLVVPFGSPLNPANLDDDDICDSFDPDLGLDCVLPVGHLLGDLPHLTIGLGEYVGDQPYILVIWDDAGNWVAHSCDAEDVRHVLGDSSTQHGGIAWDRRVAQGEAGI